MQYPGAGRRADLRPHPGRPGRPGGGRLDPGPRHQADPRGAAGAGSSRSSTTGSRPQAQATFAEAFRGDPDVRRARRRRRHASTSSSASGSRGCRSPGSSPTGTQEERDLRRAPLPGVPAGRAGAGRACCTPTRTRATSGSRPTAGSASSTSARSTGCPTACRRRSASCSRSACWGDAEGVVAGLREEGFIKASISIDGDGLLDYLVAVPGAGPARDVHVLPGLDARRCSPHINDPRRPQWSVGLKLNLPPEYLLIHRVWLGGIGVLCQIEGEVPVLEVLADWLPNFDADAVDEVRRGRTTRRPARPDRRPRPAPPSPPGAVELRLDAPEVVRGRSGRRSRPGGRSSTAADQVTGAGPGADGAAGGADRGAPASGPSIVRPGVRSPAVRRSARDAALDHGQGGPGAGRAGPAAPPVGLDGEGPGEAEPVGGGRQAAHGAAGARGHVHDRSSAVRRPGYRSSTLVQQIRCSA